MKKWNFYSPRELSPDGWMKRQLELQAKGLSGNLDRVWRDVRDSSWIGGDAEGWERVPYWLDGFIPLAYLLRDDDLIKRAKKYIDAILSFQKEDGWICPCPDEERAEYDTWAIILISKTLTVYYECSSDERIPGVVYRTLKNYYTLLKSGEIKLFNWGKFRWFETFIALELLQKHYGEEWIADMAKLLHEQGADYNEFLEHWENVPAEWRYDTHIVNLAMMFKYEAISHGMLGEDYTDRAEFLYGYLKQRHGTPVELFTGDECLGGLSPIHGSELCSVVELMYSYELLYAYTGDRKWLERLEVIAFNALPATISEDMWTHQYDQLSNQVSCTRLKCEPSIFTTNFPDSHLFGLEPNFGCCTANFGQGWPKLALSAFMYNGDRIINTVAIPSRLTTDDCSITLETDYPFENSFTYRISARAPFTFTIRIPGFAKEVTLNGRSMPTEDITLQIAAGDTELQLSYQATPYFESRPYELTTVKCGSLVYSVPVSYRTHMLEYVKKGVERKFPYCDYELSPASDWNYAYCSDELMLEERAVSAIPFSQAEPPVVIKTKAVHIDWGTEGDHADICAKIPASRVPTDAPQELVLIPYGCARLRMTELPKVKA